MEKREKLVAELNIIVDPSAKFDNSIVQNGAAAVSASGPRTDCENGNARATLARFLFGRSRHREIKRRAGIRLGRTQ